MKLSVTLFAVILMLSACSDNHNKDAVEFKANVGDSAKYWVQHVSRIDLATATIGESTTLSLLRYRIEQTDATTLRFSVIPEYFKNTPYCENQFRRLQTKVAKYCALVWEGFKLDLNPADGSLINLQRTSASGWQTMLDKGTNLLVKSLRNTVNAPGFIQTIPKIIGSKITLHDFSGFTLTMIVDKVTSETIELSFTRDDPQFRQYGKVIVNQSNGWLQHATLIAEKPLGSYQTAYTRTVMQKTNEYDAPGLITVIKDHRRVESHWTDISQTAKYHAAQDAPIDKSFFQFSQARMQQWGEIIDTDLKISYEKQQPQGEVRFENLRGQSTIDPELNIKFSPRFNPMISSTEQGVYANMRLMAMTSARLSSLNLIDSITAEMVYYPAKIESHTLPWPSNKPKTYSLGQAQLEITPVPNKSNIYEVTYISANDDYLLPVFGGVEGQFSRLPPKVGPQWLGLGDRPLVPTNQMSWQLKVDNPPEYVTVYIKNVSKKATQKHSVVWHR